MILVDLMILVTLVNLVILVILMNLVYPTILVILMKYITVMVSWFMEEDVIFPTPSVGMRCPS